MTGKQRSIPVQIVFAKEKARAEDLIHSSFRLFIKQYFQQKSDFPAKRP